MSPVDPNNPNFPSFDDLPYRKTDPAKSIWGFWAQDDQFGMLNLLTPQRILQARNEIHTGQVASLKCPIPSLFSLPANKAAGACRILNILVSAASRSSTGSFQLTRANQSTTTNSYSTPNPVKPLHQI